MKHFWKMGGRFMALLLVGLLVFAPSVPAAAQTGDVVEFVEEYAVSSDLDGVQFYTASVEGNASRDGSLYSVLNARQKLCYNALQRIGIDQILASADRGVDVNISGINNAQLYGYSNGGTFVPGDAATRNKYDSMLNDLQAAIVALRYDRPDMLWLDGTVSTQVYFRGNGSSWTISGVRYRFSLPYGGQEKAMRQRMMNEAQGIANQAKRQPDRYNQVKAAHDAICARSVYNTPVANNPALNNTRNGMLAHSAYSALLAGDAYEPVCDGYSKAFKIVCDLMDIPCVLAISDTHMWNNVKMDDGLWYNVDATWDDGRGEGSAPYFLVGSQTQIDGRPFSQQTEHVEADPFGKYQVSGAKYPRKNTQAYKYIGADYPKTTYPDVRRDDWFYDSVEIVTKLGYFAGDGNGMFNPGNRITRAEFAKVIANAMGANANQYKGRSSFKDVAPTSWYSGVAYWAKSSGVMRGDNAGFRPNDPISRQEMCVVLVRAFGIEAGSGGKTFSDEPDIASWAKNAVHICSSAGLIQGSAGKFNPKNSTLRREAATIFARYARLTGALDEAA